MNLHSELFVLICLNQTFATCKCTARQDRVNALIKLSSFILFTFTFARLKVIFSVSPALLLTGPKKKHVIYFHDHTEQK